MNLPALNIGYSLLNPYALANVSNAVIGYHCSTLVVDLPWIAMYRIFPSSPSRVNTAPMPAVLASVWRNVFSPGVYGWRDLASVSATLMWFQAMWCASVHLLFRSQAFANLCSTGAYCSYSGVVLQTLPSIPSAHWRVSESSGFSNSRKFVDLAWIRSQGFLLQNPSIVDHLFL